jgi:hypothetical protein
VNESFNPIVVSGEAPPAPAELIHELSEALTATGNYLTAAARMIETAGDSPEDLLREVLQKGMAEFARAAEAVRQLRVAL